MNRAWPGRSRTTVVLTARAGDGSVLLRRPIDVLPDHEHAVRLPEDAWIVTQETPSRSRVELGKVRRSVAVPCRRGARGGGTTRTP